MDIIKLIEEKIENLPPLPESVIKIQEICNNPNSSVKDLVEVVERDPILTAKILKIANSPFYGFTSKITSISHAISLFGMNTVLGFALESAVRKNFEKIDLSPYIITPDEFSNSSYKQNKLMIFWNPTLNLKNKQFLIPATFLNELGKAVLSEIIIEKNLKDKFMEKVKDIEITDDIFPIEREFLGISTPETTGKILYKWRLNLNIIYPIIASEFPDDADSNLKPYAYAIKAVRIAISPNGFTNEKKIRTSFKYLDKGEFSKESFLAAIKKCYS